MPPMVSRSGVIGSFSPSFTFGKTGPPSPGRPPGLADPPKAPPILSFVPRDVLPAGIRRPLGSLLDRVILQHGLRIDIEDPGVRIAAATGPVRAALVLRASSACPTAPRASR